ncbi:hypothetical protein ACFL56_02240 [Candidatus Margulisiibacteriota bacterium]
MNQFKEVLHFEKDEKKRFIREEKKILRTKDSIIDAFREDFDTYKKDTSEDYLHQWHSWEKNKKEHYESTLISLQKEFAKRKDTYTTLFDTFLSFIKKKINE